MKNKIIFSFVFFISLIVFCQCDWNWIYHFKNCLKSSKFITVFLIIDKDLEPYNYHIHQVIAELKSSHPVVVTDVKGMFDLHLYDKNFVHSSTLFIPILAILENTNVKIALKGMTRMYTNFLMPQKTLEFLFLIFNPNNTLNDPIKTNLMAIQNILKESKIKVLEIIENKTVCKKIALKTIFTTDVLLHQYNSFTKTYTIQKFATTNAIFSRTQNLDNRILKLALSPDVPILNANLDSRGCFDADTMSGPQGLILKTLADVGNFTWQIFSVGQVAGKRKRCSVNDPINSLTSQKIDVLANFIHIPAISDIEINARDSGAFDRLHFSYVRRPEKLVAVVPILHPDEVNLSGSFFMLIFSMIVLVLLIRIIACLMKFDIEFWNIENIWRVFFGIAMVDKTKIIAEKIIFYFIPIVWIIYSVSILEQLINAQFQLNHEEKISTLDELEDLRLPFMMSEQLQSLMLESKNYQIERFGKRAFTSVEEDFNKRCIDNLIFKSYRNISCLQLMSKARFHVYRSALKHKKSNIAIVNDYVYLSWMAIASAPFSSYNKRFEEIMQRLTEAGLIDKWYNNEVTQGQVDTSLEKINVDTTEKRRFIKIFAQILHIVIIGYSISIFVFVAEVIIILRRKTMQLNNSEQKRFLKYRNNYVG